jgi:hypothetical protein
MLTLSPARGTIVRPAADLEVLAIATADAAPADAAVVQLASPLPARPEVPSDDIVDEWGMQSFPASDPPANW